MKNTWNCIQIAFATLGGYIGTFLGGADGFLYTLIAFAVLDYITGVVCAIVNKNLSSEVGFKGICRKVVIFILVGIANLIDVHMSWMSMSLAQALFCVQQLSFSTFQMKVYHFLKMPVHWDYLFLVS